MAKDSEYQGWRNYETWAVALWLDNDRGLYEMVREWATEARSSSGKRAKFVLADQLKEYIDENKPELEGMWADLLNGAIDEVYWDEIAASILAE